MQNTNPVPIISDMLRSIRFLAAAGAVLFSITLTRAADGSEQTPPKATTKEVVFATHDGHAMRGKLTVPESGGLKTVVIYVQTAEGMTMDMRRPLVGMYFAKGSLPAGHQAIFEFIREQAAGNQVSR